jgi:glycosyltransferase involved in cell wall biosynthesis
LEKINELSFTFVIPTYNAIFHIERCLNSIRSQAYPQSKIEIILADGGSTDGTPELAGKYDCKVINNSKRLAEYGVQLGMLEATTDLVVVFAADNELVGNDWLAKVAKVFIRHSQISAVWGRLVSGKSDSSLNKYFELIQSDPLNWFLNQNLKLYKSYAFFPAEDYFLFHVDTLRPLVWGANGLVYRRQAIQKIWQQKGYLGDNDAFHYMVENGCVSVAYFKNGFVYHHHVARLVDWIRNGAETLGIIL